MSAGGVAEGNIYIYIRYNSMCVGVFYSFLSSTSDVGMYIILLVNVHILMECYVYTPIEVYDLFPFNSCSSLFHPLSTITVLSLWRRIILGHILVPENSVHNIYIYI